MNAQINIFDIQPTINRRNASYHSLQPMTERDKLQAVENALRTHSGLTSRQLATVTGIERTTITRILCDNENLFDARKEFYDEKTNRTVTLYRLKGK